MCGFAGVARREPRGISADLLRRMAAAVRHRGPDGFGVRADERVGLAHVRLSVLDLAGGAQPMANEDGRVLLVYNGEIFNFRALRHDLELAGHRFRTRSDTEVLIHGYEQWGPGLLERLNGQFAFAIHDRRDGSVFLARDRFGILPLHYAERGGDLYFGSEIKAILASGEVEREPDPEALDQVFTFWAARPPRTPFRGIRALEPGCWARWRDGRLTVQRYYTLDYPDLGDEPPDAIRTLNELMRSAVLGRLVADVPVGGYLSGGLDSSVICALAAAGSAYALRTFSVSFDDPRYDESEFQEAAASAVHSLHSVQRIAGSDVAQVFPDVVRHAETPLVRTGPAPLYLLSRLVRGDGVKVVLSGEGSDEIFLGYDLFKEAAVRLFCARQPGSEVRPRLFDRLYPYLSPERRAGDFWRRFFLDAGAPSDPLFSHLPRFRLTARIKEFYSPGFRASVAGFDAEADLRAALPPGFAGWSPLHRAAYLEIVTLLSPYLLSSQGDRMAMAHGVEARVPYLDHRLAEFAATLPERSKLRGLKDKRALRRFASGVLPRALAQRPKQPYRAPDVPPFFAADAPEYVRDLLAPGEIARTGIFDSRAVEGLVRRCRAGRATGVAENQALVAVLSTELWHHEFFDAPAQPVPLDEPSETAAPVPA